MRQSLHPPRRPTAWRLSWLAALALALPAGAAPSEDAAPAPAVPAPGVRYENLAELLRRQRPALFVNPCVLQADVRDNFVVTRESRAWGTRVGETVLTYLNARGLPAGPLRMPLICAQGRAEARARAADGLDTRRDAVTLPIATAPEIEPALQGALQTLYAAVGRAAEPDPLFPAATPPATRFRLDPDDRARLVQATGGRYAWVLSLTAADVSKARLFNQRFLARVAPELLAGRQAQAFSHYELGLVDLDTAAVLWKRAAGRNAPLSAPGLYGEPWAAQLFGPVLGGDGGADPGPG